MGKTVVCGSFEWDEEKAKANVKKHGISFEEAIEVFDDPYFTESYDFDHSFQGEQRIKGIGAMRGLVIVATVFVERKRTRIISARRADKDEEESYYEYNFAHDGRKNRRT